MDNDKSRIRKEISCQKKNFSLSQRLAESERIVSRLVAHQAFINAKTVFLYHSLPDEVNTHTLIKTLVDKGEKRILLPSVIGDNLQLHIIDSDSKTEKGDFGIIESKGKLFTNYDEIDLAIVPGVAFDKYGNRLGRGKGYYDRILPLLKAYKIGICFPFQHIEIIPAETHDIRMDEVIS